MAFVLSLVAQSCLTLCDLMDCILPGSSVHGDSPGKNTEVGCHATLQGIFPTQGLNPGLPHCRQILYHLSHQGSPKVPLGCKIKRHLSFSELTQRHRVSQWHPWKTESHSVVASCWRCSLYFYSHFTGKEIEPQTRSEIYQRLHS